jgi:hypothetical protein
LGNLIIEKNVIQVYKNSEKKFFSEDYFGDSTLNFSFSIEKSAIFP